MLTSLNISQIMRVLACLLIRKENFSQSVVAPRGPIGRESALAWADRYAGMGHAPRNPCFTYDAPAQKFSYQPKYKKNPKRSSRKLMKHSG